MKKNIFTDRPILLLVIIGILIFILNRFNIRLDIEPVIAWLALSGTIVYIGWINSNIINLKRKIEELEKRL